VEQSIIQQISSAKGALTAAQLAQLLSVNRITVFKMAKSGRIPSFRIGTCVRFDPATVAAWLRKQ
jgi:excisionase family DNA binding protein